MTFWKKKKPVTPGKNRGTGEFIDNIRWWFWNGAAFPGLISREQFSRIADRSLDPVERTKFSRMLVADLIVTNGQRHGSHGMTGWGMTFGNNTQNFEPCR